jgi:hypothetical protein
MPTKAPITLKREITELLASGNFGSRALILDDKDADGSPFRRDFLQLEKRWLELARSIEFGEQLGSFTKNSPKPNVSRSVTPYKGV